MVLIIVSVLHLQTSTKSSSLSRRLSLPPPHLQHKHEETREQKENQWRALIRKGSVPGPSASFSSFFFTGGVAPASGRRRRPSGVLEAIQLTPPRPFHRSGGRENKRGRPDEETRNANALNEEKLSAAAKKKHFAGKVSGDGECSG